MLVVDLEWARELRAIQVSCLFVLLLLLLCLSPAVAQQTGTVSGVVEDEVGAALPRTQVLLSGAGGTFQTLTDGDGRFRFDLVPTGTYAVTAVRAGFVVLDATAEVVAGDLLQLDLVLQLAPISEAITVTAERREASILDVPIAVTALTGEDRDLLNVITASDLAEITPNMSYNVFPNRVTIRGIGRTFNALGMDPGVANYVDGTYTSEVGGSLDINPLFIERTEVLRGPQGTLFGRNSVGGLVNVITRRPESDFGGEFRLYAGEYQTSGGALTVTGPIGQSGPRYRLNLNFDRRDEGFQKNIGSGPEVDTFKYFRGEVHLQHDFTDSFSGWMRASYGPYESSPSVPLRRGEYYTPTQQAGCCAASPFWNLTGNPSINANEVAIDYAGHKQKTEDPITVVGDLAYTTRSLLLKYMGRWSTYDWWLDVDWDGTNRSSYIDPVYGEIFTGMSNYIGEFKKFSSHELQFLSVADSHVRWIAGLYYYNENIHQPYEERVSSAVGFENPNLVWWLSPTYSPSDPGPPNPGRAYYAQDPKLHGTQAAGYTQVDIQLGSRWNLGLGARYSDDEKKGYEENALFSYNPFVGNYFFEYYHPDQVYTYYGPIPTGTTNNKRTLDDSWQAVTGRVSVDYQAGVDSIVYGSISTGYKSGGFRLGALEEDPIVDKETVIAYELGSKYLLLHDNSLMVATALFWNDYQDQQIPVMRLIESDISVQELFNIPKSETGGLELELAWQPVIGSRIGLNYGYLHSKIVSGLVMQDTLDPAGTPANFKDVTGNTLQRAPEHQISLYGAHTFDMANGGYFTLSADVSWTDEQHNTAFQGDPWNTYPAYSRAGVRLKYGHPHDAFALVLQVRNVTNEQYLSGIGNSGMFSGYVLQEDLMPPRQVSLEFQKRF